MGATKARHQCYQPLLRPGPGTADDGVCGCIRTAMPGHVVMKNGGAAAIPLDVGGTVGVGMNQSGLSVGVRHAF